MWGLMAEICPVKFAFKATSNKDAFRWRPSLLISNKKLLGTKFLKFQELLLLGLGLLTGMMVLTLPRNNSVHITHFHVQSYF